jgi:glutamyl-tRNA reductase
MEILVCGVDHRTAPLELRETLAFSPEEARAALAGLRGDGVLPEIALLSTCNRTELYAASSDVAAGLDRLRERLGGLKGLDLAPHAAGVHAQSGPAAARHLFRVAAGLDSMVLGEKQILGQVRDAHALAREEGTAGPVLDHLFQTALHAGKRAQAETQIGAGAASVPSAAVALAAKVFGNLEQRRVVVVGAGATAELAARRFAERKPAALVVANRTRERAASLAEAVGGAARPLEELPAVLLEADVVVCATRAPGFVVTAAMVARAMAGRRQRPLVLVDVAVPRDVEPEAGQEENVFLYPIDALRTIVDQSLARRQQEAPRVEVLVAEECGRFLEWLRGLEATPVVRELREHFERVRAEEVKKILSHFHESDRERVERLTKALVNKLLHAPTVRLKARDGEPEAHRERLHAVRELFALGTRPPGPEEDHGV